MNTLYLHIGLQKTGTSAIQVFSDTHRDRLKAAGLLYPDIALVSNAHHEYAQTFAEKTHWNFSQEPEKTQRDIADFVKQADMPVLLSSEFFREQSPDALKPLRDIANVKIVLYIRRQDEAIISEYNQLIKTAIHARSVEEHIESAFEAQRWDYQHIIQKWAAVFGQENIIVGIYEKSTAKPSVMANFFETIGFNVDTQVAEEQQKTINPSMDIETLAFIRAMTAAGVDVQQRQGLIERYRQRVNSTTPFSASTAFISPEDRVQLLDRYQASNEWVRTQFFPDRETLFTNKAPQPGDHWTPFFDIPQDVLTGVLIDVWNVLQQEREHAAASPPSQDHTKRKRWWQKN